MKKTPPRGMNDYLPQEVALRSYVENKILEVYQSYGYQRIITPIVETEDNLQKSEGGENLNLIFQIMKRGEKLEKALQSGGELWDLGLRYDLTLPLTRYYSNNSSRLPSPFKVIQIDRVYRAERPQKGRLREFVQCDIDMLGTSDPASEIELIAVTAEALLAVGFSGFIAQINDRRILNSFLQKCGFTDEQFSLACMAIDKLAKIGLDGVCDELRERSMPEAAIAQLRAFLEQPELTLDSIESFIGETPEISAVRRMLSELTVIAQGKWSAVFDLTIIRGQGYYTGTIFEITCPEFSGAIAGGGRYDNMVAKFTGNQVPAVGFSIGFERIISILAEKTGGVQVGKPRLAMIYNEDIAFADAFRQAQELTADYAVTLIPQAANPGKQFKKLKKEEYQAVKKLPGGEIETL